MSAEKKTTSTTKLDEAKLPKPEEHLKRAQETIKRALAEGKGAEGAVEDLHNIGITPEGLPEEIPSLLEQLSGTTDNSSSASIGRLLDVLGLDWDKTVEALPVQRISGGYLAQCTVTLTLHGDGLFHKSSTHAASACMESAVADQAIAGAQAVALRRAVRDLGMNRGEWDRDENVVAPLPQSAADPDAEGKQLRAQLKDMVVAWAEDAEMTFSDLASATRGFLDLHGVQVPRGHRLSNDELRSVIASVQAR